MESSITGRAEGMARGSTSGPAICHDIPPAAVCGILYYRCTAVDRVLRRAGEKVEQSTNGGKVGQISHH